MKGLLQFLIAKIILLALASSVVTCYDPSPLQDYCVATSNTNGGSLYCCIYVHGSFAIYIAYIFDQFLTYNYIYNN